MSGMDVHGVGTIVEARLSTQSGHDQAKVGPVMVRPGQAAELSCYVNSQTGEASKPILEVFDVEP